MSNHKFKRLLCTPEIEAVLRAGRIQPIRGWTEMAKELCVSDGTLKRFAAELGLDLTSRPIAKRADAHSPNIIAKIKELWGNGVGSVEIGRQTGLSKSAVLGKVHRLGLSGRNSPIKRDVERKSRPSRAGQAAKPKEPKPLTIANRAQGGFSTLTRTLQLAPVRPVPVFVGPTTSCCFPLWGDKERAPRPPIFCGEVSIPGRSLCLTHYRRCYIQKPLPEVSSVAA